MASMRWKELKAGKIYREFPRDDSRRKNFSISNLKGFSIIRLRQSFADMFFLEVNTSGMDFRLFIA